jgi:hypothetical protein
MKHLPRTARRALVVLACAGVACGGSDRPAGEIQGGRRPESDVAAQAER